MSPPQPFDHLVVVGGSAGAIEAVQAVVGGLPADFPAPVAIVIHLGADSPGILAQIIDRAGPLPARFAADGDRLLPGHVYVAPPDYHLIVTPGRLALSQGPRENRARPAVDPLFRSAAQVYGPRAIGVVLSGSLDDGTAGLWTIRQLGGLALVQDPADALFPSMPQSALAHVAVDHRAPARGLAALLATLVAQPAGVRAAGEVPATLAVDIAIAGGQNAHDAGVTHMGTVSPFSCPECQGVLLEWKEANRLRYRCHTGHAFTAAGLLDAVRGGIEESLSHTVRAIDEGGRLMQHFAAHFAAADPGAAQSLDTTGRRLLDDAERVRDAASATLAHLREVEQPT